MSTQVAIEKTSTRYELFVDNQLVAFADYHVVGRATELAHTVTDPNFQGRGLAAKLIRHALDDIRDAHLTVVPTCSFVARFVEDHPEYQPLLAKL